MNPGWYHAQGDPPGTQRYWDGTQWVGEPQMVGGQAPAPGAYPPPGGNPEPAPGYGAPAAGGYGAPAAGGYGGYGAVGQHGAPGPRPETDNMIGWTKLWLSRWSDFEGRSNRAEYWWSALCVGLANAVIFTVLLILAIVGFSSGGGVGVAIGVLVILVWLAYSLALMIPSLSGAVRRLHDTGRTGWLLLLGLVPFGGIILLVFYVEDSNPQANQYGPPTK